MSAVKLQFKLKVNAKLYESKNSDRKRKGKLMERLNKMIAEKKVSKGIIPICASCEKVRTNQGFWRQLEIDFRDHSETKFSHGICPDCIEKLYPGILCPFGKPA